MAISGASIAVGTVGALLVYSGLSNKSPLEALKAVSTGDVKLPAAKSGGFLSSFLDKVTADQNGLIQQGMAAAGNSPLVAAAYTHRDELYSQSKRWADGYSDCSSFVGKSLKDIGIKPPGASVTMSYRAWGQAKTISKSDIQAGDLLCGTGHIAIATGNGQAIGQQNSRKNVQVDTIANIMYGQPGWVPRRITIAVATTPNTGVAT